MRNILFVMQEVMRQIVTYVSKHSSREYSCAHVPVECKECVRKLPERCGKDEEQGWRHNET